jgi:brefeldin A-resistance guanine nucleotide exchange factor 1
MKFNTLQEEAVPESLKNILLVMADGGYLAPPSEDPSKEKIWVETRKRLERFLPDLFTEIFPNNLETRQPAVPSPITAAPPSAEQAATSPTTPSAPQLESTAAEAATEEDDLD